MKNRSCLLVLIAVLLLHTSCASTVEKEKTPITITVWHVYGGQTDSPHNDLINQFNENCGKRARNQCAGYFSIYYQYNS